MLLVEESVHQKVIKKISGLCFLNFKISSSFAKKFFNWFLGKLFLPTISAKLCFTDVTIHNHSDVGEACWLPRKLN